MPCWPAKKPSGPAQPKWAFEPPTLTGLCLTVAGLQDGAYTARWFDPQTGQWLAAAAGVAAGVAGVQSTGGALALPVPDFSRDLALKLN